MEIKDHHDKMTSRATELVQAIEADDLFYVLRALEKKFEIRTSIIDRSEIAELAACYCENELTDDKWEEFKSSSAWEDWNVDSWEAWKDLVGMGAVRELVDGDDQ